MTKSARTFRQNNMTKHVGIRVTPEDFAGLALKAENQGSSVSLVIRAALADQGLIKL